MAPPSRWSYRRILAALAVIAAIGAVVFALIDLIGERRAQTRAVAAVQEIIAMLDLAALPDFHQRVDRIRAFINDNSKHRIDDAFRANQGNASAFANGVIAHAKGLRAEPIHMECSTRSNLMTRILRALGYETRIVAIFNSRDNLKSHSFLEVMNPETGRWETQDPDYDIYWRSKALPQRISLADSAEAIEDIEPCGRENCGWDHVSREGIKVAKLKDYLDILSITDKHKDARYAFYTSRADLEGPFSKGRKRGRFCQVEERRCQQGFFDIRKHSTYAAGLLR